MTLPEPRALIEPIGATAGPLQTTTGSVDPTLAADLVVGSRAIVMVGGNVRAPVVQGRDQLRQGIFARGDLRGRAPRTALRTASPRPA